MTNYKGDFVATFEDIDYNLYQKNETTPREAFRGCLYETYGEDKAYVEKVLQDDALAHRETRIDSILEEKGEVFVLRGYWAINRLGFLIRKEVKP